MGFFNKLLIALRIKGNQGRVWRQMQGRHVIISGGSKGLGLAVAVECAKRGAHVTIFARNKSDLDAAVTIIKSTAQDPSSQIIRAFSIDVTDFEVLQQKINGEISKSAAGIPSLVLSCAGAAIPKFFLEQPIEDFKWTMDVNYLGTVNFVQCCSKLIVDNGVKDAHVVMVSSVASYLGIVGFASYAPAKFAVRALAECLRQELKPYGVHVHMMAPGTILTEGFEMEQRTKPEVTKKLEGEDGQTPEQIAKAMFSGLEENLDEITSDFIGHLARCVAGGVVQGNASFLDRLSAMLGWIVFYVYSFIVDHEIAKDFEERKSKQTKST